MPRSLTKALRLMALLCFALAQVAQPVLAAMGDVHVVVEHAVDASNAHPHAHETAVRADALQDESSPSALHTLLHLTHCCGQSPATATPAVALPAFVATRSATVVPSQPPRHETRRGVPYRPPITA